jgi:hypothetical protein
MISNRVAVWLQLCVVIIPLCMWLKFYMVEMCLQDESPKNKLTANWTIKIAHHWKYIAHVLVLKTSVALLFLLSSACVLV